MTHDCAAPGLRVDVFVFAAAVIVTAMAHTMQAGEAAEGEGDPERGLAGGGEALAKRHAAQGGRYRLGEGPRREYP